jgi:serine/threonine-protein kinase
VSGLAEPDGDDRELAARLFDEAHCLPEMERAAFIAAACGDDDALRADIEELLAQADAARGFFALLSDAVIQPLAQGGLVAGRYKIGGCLGIGGMGAVYRAHDTLLQRDVALKFLPPPYAPVPGSEEQLLQEARAAAALEHPNVCAVHEIATTEDGRSFISMAFYDGVTLKERLAHGPLPLTETIEIARQISCGLAAAHAQGIVHRDVKPGNIMLLQDGMVKLLDFGLARVSDVRPSSDGVTTGTLAYMSPEQSRGHAVAASSDLFSLGVVLYEIIAGRHPFRNGNPSIVIDSIQHGAPEPLRKHNPAVPRSLERIVSRLLEKEPAARYVSTRDLLVDLDRVASTARMRRVASRPGVLALLLMIVAVVGTASWWALHEPGLATAADNTAGTMFTGTGTELSTRTVAVLPFSNTNRSPEDDYLVDGLTDELIGTLSKVRALRVIARTSAFVFKGATQDIRDIGRALGADIILEGSVQRAGERVRVRAQLINVADGVRRWSDVYDREITDILELQQDLALRIANALEAALTPAERARVAEPPTTNSEAYAFYLKGRHWYKRRTRDGLLQSINYYQRAIDTDPQFAAAYAGLAAVYSLQGIWEYLSPVVARERMRQAARRAIQLDDELAEAHAVWGAYLHVYEWDSEQAERSQLRALQLDPRFVMARLFYGNLLRSLGRYDEAAQQYRMGAHLDPLDPIMTEMLGRTMLLSGNAELARKQFHDAIELDSTFWWPHAGLGLYYEMHGLWTKALKALRHAHELKGSVLPDIARVLARAGREHEAREMLNELQAEAERTGLHDPDLAPTILALSDRARAHAWLARSTQERHPELRFIAGHVPFQAFEEDPLYIDLLRRMGVRR